MCDYQLYHVRLITYNMSLRVEQSNHNNAITSLRYRCVRNNKYLAGHDITN
jgi:hypothetical protein